MDPALDKRELALNGQPAILVPILVASEPLKRLLHGALGFAAILTAAAVLSKLAAGLAVYQKGVRRWPVGVGMVPRGEVGLIFAGLGLVNHIIDEGFYAALVAMVMVSTFIAPPWLKVLYRRPRRES